MKLPVPNPKAMLADRGYDSDSFRQELLFHGILPVIPSRKVRSAPQKTDWARYRDRNHIERMFNRLKQMDGSKNLWFWAYLCDSISSALIEEIAL